MADVRQRAKQPETAQESSTQWLEEFVGPELILASGDGFEVVPTSERCRGKHIALYFSASWCGPCRSFTPKLQEFYTEAQKTESIDVEIVYVSLDRDEPGLKVRYQCQRTVRSVK
jgi:thiol-disulfide isomerase/thioredoxin